MASKEGIAITGLTPFKLYLDDSQYPVARRNAKRCSFTGIQRNNGSRRYVLSVFVVCRVQRHWHRFEDFERLAVPTGKGSRPGVESPDLVT